ncbi:MAG: GNAT family N-acetyltransferase [Hyphomicrobium sp.]
MFHTLTGRNGADLGKSPRARPKGLAALQALADTSARMAPFARQPEPKIYGRVGDLEVRLARSRAEIRMAQRLRYQVFYEEMSATPSRLAQFRRRDEDAYDAICDHLLVVDLSKVDAVRRPGHKPFPKVVGTYRILRQDVAARQLGFYTSSEYNIAPLIEAKPDYKFMELGRSCVLAPYRGKRSVELLWHGLWTYVREHGIDVMIGCASFEGANPRDHAMALSFLHHFARAPDAWRCRAHEKLRVPMDLVDKDKVEPKAALKALPPLIKGYLRLGAFVGEDAVIDTQFGTTDVLIVLPVEKIDPRYFEHYGAPSEKKARIAADA